VIANTSEDRPLRPEIQGLRAIAVAAVICFHIWPVLLQGGYVGVDIFFVISGYLITGGLFRSLFGRDYFATQVLCAPGKETTPGRNAGPDSCRLRNFAASRNPMGGDIIRDCGQLHLSGELGAGVARDGLPEFRECRQPCPALLVAFSGGAVLFSLADSYHGRGHNRAASRLVPAIHSRSGS
jgi:hypothetical protein